MKHLISVRTVLLLAAIAGSAFTLQAVAAEITFESAREMRQDAAVAEQALNRVLEQTASQDVRIAATEAKDAVGRMGGQLDGYIAGEKAAAKAKAADVYDGGKKYPPAANVQIESFDVPVGATVVHVPVTLDKPSVNTVIAHIRVFDGKGGRANPDTRKALIFRPGDPLTKTVSFNVREMKEGNTVRCVQQEVPDGGNRKGGEITISARSGAANTPIEDGREGITFEPLGQAAFSVTGQTIQYDDKGGPMSFSTALSHGRTQVGNGETGYYGTVDMGAFSRTDEGLVLATRRLDAPMKVGSPAMEYPFLAAMLSGHKTPETYFKYGSVEWVVKMPNRRSSWPALWLLPTGGWPPEIDVYEGFGYNGSWIFSSDLSTNIHGGTNLDRTFTRPAMRMKMSSFGLPNTLDSDFHTFAVTVDEQWITLFVDGVETMQYANPFKGETWYPLTNVAVKANPDAKYEDGSGEMVLKSLKIWRKE
ncbi:MAG: family 16 glycosylhydrolase [Patescibacteria group bacterium]|nr:family 16 glycosylhydrolase [Patescibacteria group bacterium]